MADLHSRIEVRKLAAVLDVDEAELGYLAMSSPGELRRLRRVTAEALQQRHEARIRVLASLSGMLPVGAAAKIAETALGAALSARVAGVMEPEAAAKLAGHLSPAFLAELAVKLDAGRVDPIVGLLPEATVLDVAHRLLAAGELITLARFVAVVDAETAVGVAQEATGAELLWLMLYTEDDAALSVLAERLPEEALAQMVAAASDEDERVAVAEHLGRLDPEVRERVLGAA